MLEHPNQIAQVTWNSARMQLVKNGFQSTNVNLKLKSNHKLHSRLEFLELGFQVYAGKVNFDHDACMHACTPVSIAALH